MEYWLVVSLSCCSCQTIGIWWNIVLVSVRVGLRFQKKFIEIKVLNSIIVFQKKYERDILYARTGICFCLLIKEPPIKIGSQVWLKNAFFKKMHSEQWNAGFGEKEQDAFKLTFTILLSYAILDFGVKKIHRLFWIWIERYQLCTTFMNHIERSV